MRRASSSIGILGAVTQLRERVRRIIGQRSPVVQRADDFVAGNERERHPWLEIAGRPTVDSGQVEASDVVRIPYGGSGYFAFKAFYLGYGTPDSVEARWRAVSSSAA